MSELLVTVSTGEYPEETVIGNVSDMDSIGPTMTSESMSVRQTPGLLDIPGYTILRKLGEGGMGIVYEALRAEQNDRVAIKTIIPNKGTPRQAIELFQREMTLLSKLQHPHIVGFLGGGEFAGQIYLVMEYVETVDVQTFAKDLASAERVRLFCGIACQILSALDHAHQQKLVHRDVKPRNILVTRDGKRFAAKLADFGLAKNFEQAGLSQLTADNEIRGTPAFMPWEQFQNSRYAKPAVDLYSTAATLFYYLTGKSPGHTNPSGRSQTTLGSFLSLFARSQSNAAAEVAISTELSDLPSGLAAVLNRALASAPKHRFPSALEMRDALLPFTSMPKT
jgi:serine/threonine-protein kinase